MLVVEVDDEAVAVELKKSGLTVRDKETGQEYQVWTPGEQELAAGQYELHVTNPAGLKVSTDTFTLTRGGREIVRITLQKDEAIAKTDAPTPSEPAPGPVPPQPGPSDSADAVLRPARRRSNMAIRSVRRRSWHTPRRWRVRSRGRWTPMRPRGVVHALAFQPNCHLLAMGGDDAMIRLWDVDAEKLVAILAGHAARITCLGLVSRWSPHRFGQ